MTILKPQFPGGWRLFQNRQTGFHVQGRQGGLAMDYVAPCTLHIKEGGADTPGHEEAP